MKGLMSWRTGTVPTASSSTVREASSPVTARTRLQAEDWRALTPLIYAHIHPYGLFNLDMSERLEIELLQAA